MLKFSYIYNIIGVIFLIAPVLASAAPQDIYNFTRISYVSPAPDGRQAAIVTMKAVKKADVWQWQYALYHQQSPRQLSLWTTDINITYPTWSSDGKYVAYLTKTKTDSSIWLIKLANNQKSKLTTFKGDIASFKWSPDSRFIAFTGTENPATPPDNALIDISQKITPTRLYLLPVKFAAVPEALTPYTLSVATGFGDAGFDWAPDQKSIAIVSQPEGGSLYNCHIKIQIYDLETKQLKSLPYLQDHFASQPLYSPDGKWLAFRTNAETTNVDTTLKNNIFYVNNICAINLLTQKNQCLADTDNQNPTMLSWNAASNAIYVMDFHKTDGPEIVKLTLDPKVPAKLISTLNGFIEPLTLSFNNTHTTVGFGYETTNNAPEAYISPVEPFNPVPTSTFNKKVPPAGGGIQVINWRGSDAKIIEALLITPRNYQPLKKYPLLVSVHGGPVGAAWKRYLGGCDEFQDMFVPTSCWQSALEAGFVILEPNYRGSTGYGADFRIANYRDLGGQDYQDIQAGVDYLIAKGIADPNNLFINGWSYGGYLTAWTISQTTRYKAAVDGDGLSDLLSFSGTSDIPFYASVYLGSLYWDDSFLYIKRSPIIYAKNIVTPLLLLSGQHDIRVPSTQSLEMYTALKVLKKPVQFYLMPNQGHVPQDPMIILEAIDKINAWYIAAMSKQNETK